MPCHRVKSRAVLKVEPARSLQTSAGKGRPMSIDRSLKLKSGLAVNRSVYTRAERLAKLVEAKKKDTGKDGILGVAKTRVAKA